MSVYSAIGQRALKRGATKAARKSAKRSAKRATKAVERKARDDVFKATNRSLKVNEEVLKSLASPGYSPEDKIRGALQISEEMGDTIAKAREAGSNALAKKAITIFDKAETLTSRVLLSNRELAQNLGIDMSMLPKNNVAALKQMKMMLPTPQVQRALDAIETSGAAGRAAADDAVAKVLNAPTPAQVNTELVGDYAAKKVFDAPRSSFGLRNEAIARAALAGERQADDLAGTYIRRFDDLDTPVKVADDLTTPASVYDEGIARAELAAERQADQAFRPLAEAVEGAPPPLPTPLPKTPFKSPKGSLTVDEFGRKDFVKGIDDLDDVITEVAPDGVGSGVLKKSNMKRNLALGGGLLGGAVGLNYLFNDPKEEVADDPGLDYFDEAQRLKGDAPTQGAAGLKAISNALAPNKGAKFNSKIDKLMKEWGKVEKDLMAELDKAGR